MSITFPTFVDKEIVTPEKLNTFVQAIEAKFTAGLGTAEIQWPLIAGGNLIMGTNEITGATKIMKVVNAEQYATLQAALTAGSGGIVYIPPNTTIQADGVSLIGTTCAIVGAGPTSVLKVSDSPSAGYFMRNDSMGAGTQFLIANLTFDGNSEAGGDGLFLRHTDSAIVHNCWFKNWAGSALRLTSGAGSGDDSENVHVTDCEFIGGADHHIRGDSCDRIVVKGCISEDCDTKAFEFVAADASSVMRRIGIVDNQIINCDEESIRVLGGSGTPNSLWSNVVIQGNLLEGGGGSTFDIITLGGAAAVIEAFNISGNILRGALAVGIMATGNDGVISGNTAESCGDSAISLDACNRVKVCGNMLANAGAYGVATANADSCQVHDNDVSGASTGGVQLASTNGTFIQYHNQGMVGVPPQTGYYSTSTRTITLPANLLHVGDSIHIWTAMNAAGGTGSDDFAVSFDGGEVCRTYSGTATGKRLIACVGVVKNTTQVQWMGSGLVDDREVNIDFESSGGHDFTAAITVIADTSGLTSDTFGGIFIELRSGTLV